MRLLKNLAYSLGAAVFWLGCYIVLNYKTEALELWLDRQGLLSATVSGFYGGWCSLPALAAALSYPWVLPLLRRRAFPNGALASGFFYILVPSAPACLLLAARYPVARGLALVWYATAVAASFLTFVLFWKFLPSRNGPEPTHQPTGAHA